jgi:hypothetical protein
MWKLNKSIAKDFLPTLPVDFPIDPWWGVCLVNFTIEEFKKLSEDEMATIDKICKEEANAYFLFDPEVIKGLYQRGLVYFDVPVYQDDRFKGEFMFANIFLPLRFFYLYLQCTSRVENAEFLLRHIIACQGVPIIDS